MWAAAPQFTVDRFSVVGSIPLDDQPLPVETPIANYMLRIFASVLTGLAVGGHAFAPLCLADCKCAVAGRECRCGSAPPQLPADAACCCCEELATDDPEDQIAPVPKAARGCPAAGPCGCLQLFKAGQSPLRLPDRPSPTTPSAQGPACLAESFDLPVAVCREALVFSFYDTSRFALQSLYCVWLN